MNETTIDHRRLQRVLFRMFLDPVFADAILGDVPPVIQATGLGDTELAWLKKAGRAAIGADKDGKRRGQVTGNVQIEYRSTIAVACVLGHGDRFAEDFLSAPEFHDAIAHDGRLPRAFGAYAARRAELTRSRLLEDTVKLERAMVEARRFDAPVQAFRKDGYRLSASARTIEVADGVFTYLEDLRAALDRGETPSAPPVLGLARETILLTARSAGPHRAREVLLERLEPAVADLLIHAKNGVAATDIARIAAFHGAAAADVMDFADSLAADGVLERTRGQAP